MKTQNGTREENAARTVTGPSFEWRSCQTCTPVKTRGGQSLYFNVSFENTDNIYERAGKVVTRVSYLRAFFLW